MEEEIRKSLVLLLDAIKRSDGKALTGEIGRLENLLAQGRAALDPRLVHFLERRSYAKALALLGGAAETDAGRALLP